MDVKSARRLSLRDLPNVESPFFAASEVESRLRFGASSILEAKIADLLDPHPGARFRRSLDREKMREAFEEGDIFLVIGGYFDKPFDPLVVWEEDSERPKGGFWRVTRCDLFGFRAFENQIAHLNEWELTPDDIAVSGPGEVGHLSVSEFDMDLRQRRADEKSIARQEQQRQLSTPLGGLANVAPLPAAAAINNATTPRQKKPEQRKAIHLEVGIFTDGTLNNAGNIEIYQQRVKEECLVPRESGEIDDAECERRLALMLGDSYANAASNIAKLFELYAVRDNKTGDTIKHKFPVYEPGAGSKTGGDDSLIGMATGLGETGVIAQVIRAFSQIALRVNRLIAGKTIDRLTVDLFGFSRGAAAARHAAHEIGRGASGRLGQMLAQYEIKWPNEVVIRFVGLFDTVAGVVSFSDGDFAASNDQNAPVNLFLDPANVEKAVQLTALDERRANFALNSLQSPDGSIPNNFREINLPGVHSDLGGGYHEIQTEDVLLNPVLTIKDSRTEWPKETSEWDNLVALRQRTEAEGWIGQQSIMLASGEPPLLKIDLSKDEHPTPHGRVDLSLRMKRQVKGEYSRVTLKLMHQLATDAGVLFDDISSGTFDIELPGILTSIHETFSEQVNSGSNAPELSANDHAVLKQRYIHHSDNYNWSESLMGDTIVKSEMPFRTFLPFKPAPDFKRRVYANKKEQ